MKKLATKVENSYTVHWLHPASITFVLFADSSMELKLRFLIISSLYQSKDFVGKESKYYVNKFEIFVC